jgi:hypothetical protein
MKTIGKTILRLEPCSVESFDAATGTVRAFDSVRSEMIRAKFNGFQVHFLEFDPKDAAPVGVEWSCLRTEPDGRKIGVVIVPDLEFLHVEDVEGEV